MKVLRRKTQTAADHAWLQSEEARSLDEATRMRRYMYEEHEAPADWVPALQALSDACRVHGVSLGGCGCCRSPWLARGDGTLDELSIDADGTITIG